MALKTILFDLDDTLFDHFEASRGSLTEIWRHHADFGRQPFEEFEREYHQRLNALHQSVLRGHLSQKDARLERWRQLFVWCGAEHGDERIRAVAESCRERYLALRRPVPGAYNLLARLKTHYIIGIVTNNLTAKQVDKLTVCGFNSLIDFMVTSEEVGVTKPEPEIFHEALRRADCLPHEAVMVGDSWQADVQGARGAGIRAVWLNRHRQPCPDPTHATELVSFVNVEESYRTITEI